MSIGTITPAFAESLGRPPHRWRLPDTRASTPPPRGQTLPCICVGISSRAPSEQPLRLRESHPIKSTFGQRAAVRQSSRSPLPATTNVSGCGRAISMQYAASLCACGVSHAKWPPMWFTSRGAVVIADRRHRRPPHDGLIHAADELRCWLRMASACRMLRLLRLASRKAGLYIMTPRAWVIVCRKIEKIGTTESSRSPDAFHARRLNYRRLKSLLVITTSGCDWANTFDAALPLA